MNRNASATPSGDSAFIGALDQRFQVRRLLGAGGMSIVLRAHDTLLGREVAVKLVRCGPGAEARARRLLLEAKTVSRLRSPHVARVLDLGWLDAHTPFIVMELIEGQDLASLLRSDGPMPLERAVRCMLGVCDALVEAHAAGVIHRDLKPANLMITEHDVDRVKVLDFGLAKEFRFDSSASNVTRGQFIGTPRYMAPEQLSHAAKLDERVDVWAAAVTLHELASSRTPFEGESESGLVHDVLTAPPRRLSQHVHGVPSELDALLLKCLEKAPHDRLASLELFRSGLQRLLGELAVVRTAPFPRPRLLELESSDTLARSSTTANVSPPEVKRLDETPARSPSAPRKSSRAAAGWGLIAAAAMLGSGNADMMTTAAAPAAKDPGPARTGTSVEAAMLASTAPRAENASQAAESPTTLGAPAISSARGQALANGGIAPQRSAREPRAARRAGAPPSTREPVAGAPGGSESAAAPASTDPERLPPDVLRAIDTRR